MSTPTIEPADATLGAIVTGIDLRRLEAAQWREVEAAFIEHAVLIFPGQHLSDTEQAAFGRRFGVVSIEAAVLSNLDADGNIRQPDDTMMTLLRGNEGWHTDSSFEKLAAKASILSARIVPATGGETQWADMRAAYAALDDLTRSKLEGLKAFHSVTHAQARLGQDAAETKRLLNAIIARQKPGDPGAGEIDEPPLRPLVKFHPVTNRPALYIGRHAYGIPGLDKAASAQLLDQLVDFACREPRVYQHHWQPGDLAIWDNRCVLHRARPWDTTLPRLMVHTRVAGDPASEIAGE